MVVAATVSGMFGGLFAVLLGLVMTLLAGWGVAAIPITLILWRRWQEAERRVGAWRQAAYRG